jgi:hypothetical protein
MIFFSAIEVRGISPLFLTVHTKNTDGLLQDHLHRCFDKRESILKVNHIEG